MNIHDIKKNIKKNKRIRFIVEHNIDKCLFVESILLKFGYKWMGINDSRKLDYLSDENPFSININSISNGKITYNSDSFYIDINDICINELSDDQLVSLFMDEPTYKPKKIQRII